MRWPTVVDLYSGCGGVTAALRRKHFKVVAAVDNDPLAGETYKLNNKSTHLYSDDIQKVNPAEIRERQLGGEELDLLVVCSPCQPFSNQNRNRENDARARLILQAPRFAKVLRPKVIFFENVPGLARLELSDVLQTLRSRLKKIGYTLSVPTTVDLADYGVPQRRYRCILFATRKGYEIELPVPTTPIGKRKSVKSAIGDLPSLKSGQKDEKDPLHFARNHQPIALKRMAHIKKNGGDRFSLPPELELDCHKGKKGFPDVYGRMHWERIAPTLTTGCTDVTKGRFMHPRDNRAITLREAARLQTFPDKYEFAGNSGQIATQIGNAVPPAFIDALAPALRKVMR
jgi:DNA (cytosine-5)-methyltransferase 1